jgi:hypothetical protein
MCGVCKPNLQLLCNFVVINASEGSLCFQILILAIGCLYRRVLQKSISHFKFWRTSQDTDSIMPQFQKNMKNKINKEGGVQ